MGELKAYWIKSGISKVWLAQDLESPWSDETGWAFDPGEWKQKHAGACMFSKLEKEKYFVKVWLYNFRVSNKFKRSQEDRDGFIFWVNPAWLEEVPI